VFLCSLTAAAKTSSSCGRSRSFSLNMMSKTMARGFCAARPATRSAYTERGPRPAACFIAHRREAAVVDVDKDDVRVGS
jgi:hypothetical protein